jgi:hypothetical protein
MSYFNRCKSSKYSYHKCSQTNESIVDEIKNKLR